MELNLVRQNIIIRTHSGLPLHLPMHNQSSAQDGNKCDSANLEMESLQWNLSWYGSVHWFERSRFRKVWMDAWTEAQAVTWRVLLFGIPQNWRGTRCGGYFVRCRLLLWNRLQSLHYLWSRSVALVFHKKKQKHLYVLTVIHLFGTFIVFLPGVLMHYVSSSECFLTRTGNDSITTDYWVIIHGVFLSNLPMLEASMFLHKSTLVL